MSAASFQLAPMGVVGAIPLVITHYNASPTLIQTAFALPTLTAVPASIIIGMLAVKTRKKLPLQIGIFLMLISGLAIALFDLPLSGFIACMSIMGLGLGCLMTLCAGIIADHYKGLEQGKILAHMSAFGNIGGMLLASAGGFLIALGWQYTFWIFLYATLILILTQVLLPQESTKINDAHNKKIKIKLNSHVFIMCGVVFFMGLGLGIRNANVGLLVIEQGLGDPATANFATTFWTASGIVVGIIYGIAAKLLKTVLLPFFLGLFAIGMIFIGNATALWMYYLGNILAGIGIGAAGPTIMSLAVQSVDKNSTTFVISIVIATLNIATFAAPVIVNTIALIIGNETAQVCFNIGAILLILLCVFSLFYLLKREKVLTS